MTKLSKARPSRGAHDALERLEALCRRRGQRVTRQRRAVLRQLLSEGRALSAYELFARLRPEDGRSTPAGVYRALECLMQAGVVHRLECTRAFILCEHPEALHGGQLLICRSCGQVVEAEDERVAAATDRLGERLGFSLDQGVVELTGLCARCRRAAH